MTRTGRPGKKDLSDAEFATLDALRARGGRGSGWRALAAKVNTLRKVNEIASPTIREQKTVSPRWVERQYEKRGKTPSAAKVPSDQGDAEVRQYSPQTSDSGPRIDPEWSPEPDEVLAGLAADEELVLRFGLIDLQRLADRLDAGARDVIGLLTSSATRVELAAKASVAAGSFPATTTDPATNVDDTNDLELVCSEFPDLAVLSATHGGHDHRDPEGRHRGCLFECHGSLKEVE